MAESGDHVREARDRGSVKDDPRVRQEECADHYRKTNGVERVCVGGGVEQKGCARGSSVEQ